MNSARVKTFLLCTDGGDIDLYYDNTKVFETISKGIQVSASDTGSDSEIIIKSIKDSGNALLTMISDNGANNGDGYPNKIFKWFFNNMF